MSAPPVIDPGEPQTMDPNSPHTSDRAFAFLRVNHRPPKPRTRGITEIRGPYYTPMGKRYLQDVLETMGAYIDILKFAGGSFALMPVQVVMELIDLCHAHAVRVSTGGFIEYVLTQGAAAVRQYVRACKELGFDIIEISSGFITVPTDDLLRLVETVQKAGLKAKPEVGIQFGAGGASGVAALEAEGTRDPDWAIMQAQRFLEAGASLIMIESEGITENVREWRTEVAARIINALGLDQVFVDPNTPEPDIALLHYKQFLNFSTKMLLAPWHELRVGPDFVTTRWSEEELRPETEAQCPLPPRPGRWPRQWRSPCGPPGNRQRIAAREPGTAGPGRRLLEAGG
jgi:phosphosulfolactate synthase (CoM biosynthesis protein A)